MKFFKFTIALVLLGSTIYFANAFDQCPLSKNGKKQCYCAFACGPREIKPDDKPFTDQATGIYFCQERDRKEYNRRGNKCRSLGNACTAS